MKYKVGKWLVWVVGFTILLVAVKKMDFGDLANWIQYLSGYGMVYALGLFMEDVLPHLKHLKEMKAVHMMVKELHEYHIGGKKDGEGK